MEIPADATIDRYGVLTIGVIGEEIIKVVPMIYNDRITVASVEDHETGYSHGWCYPKGGHWIVAIVEWDPLTQDEPPGYIKRATPGRRRAPQLTGEPR